MFEKLWINWIHPDLKERVLAAKEQGASVSWHGGKDGGIVEIKRGPLSRTGYDAKTGEIIMRN